MERKHINGFVFAAAILRGQLAALGTAFFKAILIAADAKTQLKKILAGAFFVVVVHQHTVVVTVPFLLRVVAAYNILDGTRNMLLLHVKQIHAGFNCIAMRYLQYI